MSCFCLCWLAPPVLSELTITPLELQIPHGKCFVACFNLLYKTRGSSIDSYTEFSPRSFVSINEWLLNLNETLNEDNGKSLV